MILPVLVFLAPKIEPMKTKYLFRNALLSLFALVLTDLLGQESLPTKGQKDLGDFISSENAVSADSLVIKKLYLPILPIIGYAPANGFLVGFGLAPAILLDSSHHTHLSTVLANVQLTSKSQKNANIRHNIYTRKDNWIIQGDWRILLFTQPTYGLGVYDFPPVLALGGMSLGEDDGSQPMNFNYLRLYETVFRRVYQRLYAGVGFALDYHWDIEDLRLNLDPQSPFLTSHYIYSMIEGYTVSKYTTNGLMLRAVYDDRDKSVNAHKGIYADVGFRLNNQIFGSDQNSTQLQLELRKYLTLEKEKQQLAVWLMSSFILSGSVPYLALPSLGWDTYNRSGRGFIQGRFRGRNYVYGEAEYRFRLTPSGFLGGVLFLNTLTADNKYAGQSLGDQFAMGYGAGLRIKMSKETRTNICIDLGFGSDGSKGIYFGLQEVF